MKNIKYSIPNVFPRDPIDQRKTNDTSRSLHKCEISVFFERNFLQFLLKSEKEQDGSFDLPVSPTSPKTVWD
jgi:hypothetical protein